MATCTRCPTTTDALHGLCDDCLAADVRETRAAQGLPEHVADPVALRKVATLLSTSASSSPAPASAVPVAGGEHGVVGKSSEPVRLSTGSPSDRGTPDQGLRSTVAFRRPDLEQSVSRHPSATKQEGRAATRPSRTPAAG